jgi:hypothetical protein
MKYEEARNEANRLVRKAKYEYERSIAINMKEDGFCAVFGLNLIVDSFSSVL